MASITVLRLGHRIPRDERVTTHVALTARALGATRILVDRRDRELEARIASVVKRFGGAFEIETGVAWRRILKDWRGIKVHLTMYGESLEVALPRILETDELLIIVGAEKVPSEVFDIADLNVAVGNQPHSEVAALAIFLDGLTRGRAKPNFKGGELVVVPSARGKVVVRRGTTPTVAEAMILLGTLAVPEAVKEHCEAVASWAQTIAKAAGVNVGLTVAGALLHDVGRSRSHNWDHGPLGADLLRSLGLSEDLCRIVECHMGAGLTAGEAAARGLAPRDLIPGTLEAKIVCVADRMTRGTRPLTVAEAEARVVAMDLPVDRFRSFISEHETRCGRPLDSLRISEAPLE